MLDNVVSRPASLIDRDFIWRHWRPEEEAASNFAGTLQEALGTVNRLQVEADEAVEGLLTGDMQNLHQVMIRAEEAQLSLQFTVQVVTKALQAYQDIARMQI